MSVLANEDSAEREIVVSRVIEGSSHLVYLAFTDESHLGQWWGPDGFSITTEAFQFTEGGEWVFSMHGPDGTDYPNWVEFQEIVPQVRIVLLHGERRGDPEAFTSVITFAPVEGGIEVMLRAIFPTTELRDRAAEEYHAAEGAAQTLGRLAEYVGQPKGETR